MKGSLCKKVDFWLVNYRSFRMGTDLAYNSKAAVFDKLESLKQAVFDELGTRFNKSTHKVDL